MIRFKSMLAAAALSLAAAPAFAGVSSYVKIPDIDGESKSAATGKGVEVLDIKWSSATREGGASASRAIAAASAVATTVGAATTPPAKGSVTLTLPKGFAGRDVLERAFRAKQEIPVLEFATPVDGGERAYLKYKLERCFIKSWSTSGDADDRPTEEVAFYYNKISSATHSVGTAEIDFVEVGGGSEAGTAEIEFVETAGESAMDEKPKRARARKRD